MEGYPVARESAERLDPFRVVLLLICRCLLTSSNGGLGQPVSSSMARLLGRQLFTTVISVCIGTSVTKRPITCLDIWNG